jgi:hypothetical protein
LYCSHSCRQRAHERKKWRQPHLLVQLNQDLANVAIRAAVREEAWALLRQMRLVMGPAPPENRRQSRPALRLVEADEGCAATGDQARDEV